MVEISKPIPDVIILNGTSSAGKTSIARKLCEEFGKNCCHIQIDTIARDVKEGSVRQAFVDAIRGNAEAGRLVIADTVYGRVYMNDLEESLWPHRSMIIAVKASLEEVKRREIERGDRKIGLAESQYHGIYKGIEYSFGVDTTHMTPQQAARLIYDRLHCRI